MSSRVLTYFLTLFATSCVLGVRGSAHTNNWAVIVDTSRYWFNYRHIANALSIYRSVKRLGIPDSHIILMLADDMACNPRNPHPGTVYPSAGARLNVYGDDIEVDYRGYEVTVENFIRVLTGRVSKDTPRSKRLLSDERSNILVYMTGHGGDGFLKFQDQEEITSPELADAFEQMWQRKRYNEIFFMIDTCQAISLAYLFYSPNIFAAASSSVGEDSLSHDPDSEIGVFVVDRWTYYTLQFLEKVTPTSKATVGELFRSYDARLVRSTPRFRTDLFKRDLNKVLITDFFGSVRNIQLSSEAPVNVSAKSTAGPNDNADSPLSDLEWTLSESLDNTFATDEKRQNWTTPPLIPFVASCVIVLLTFLFSNR